MNSDKAVELTQNGSSIIVHSGNITNWIPLHKKQILSTADMVNRANSLPVETAHDYHYASSRSYLF